MWIEYGDYYRFTYSVDEIFNFCTGKSMYRTKGSEIDVAINEDDKQYFIALLKRAGTEVFKRISTLGEDVTDPYKYRPDDSTSTSTVDESTGLVYTLNFDANWNEDLLDTFDLKLMDCIVSNVLQAWFRTQGLPDIAFEMGYDNDIKELIRMTNYRLVPIQKSYNNGFN